MRQKRAPRSSHASDAYLCLRSLVTLKLKVSSCGVVESSFVSSSLTSSPKFAVFGLEISLSLLADAENPAVECDVDEEAGPVGETGESDARLDVDRDEEAFFLGGGASGQVHCRGYSQQPLECA